MYVIKRSNGNK